VITAICVALLAIAGLSKLTEERYPLLRSWMRRSFGTVATGLDDRRKMKIAAGK
jgi:hypothetical protein